MRSVGDLAHCAHRHLSNYVDPGGPRAFRCYDLDSDPDVFGPLDALAPALLDAPVPGSIVIQMFSGEDDPYAHLRWAIQRLLDETTAHEPNFEDLDLDDPAGDWALVREVLRRSDDAPGLAASKVTKLLHRKRPRLVPIFDSKVAVFYGTSARTPWNLWPRLQRDMMNASQLIDDLRFSRFTPDGRSLSRLRTVDIVIWEHQVTGCSGKPTE